MKERKPHILDSIFEKVKNPTAGKSCVSSQRSEESEDLSEKSKRQVTVQILKGGLSDVGLLNKISKKSSIMTQKDVEIDSDGEYLESVWDKDLKYRQFKKDEKDSEVDIDEQYDEDFCGELTTGDCFGELGLT